MNRRLVFTAVAAAALLGGGILVAGLGVAAVADALVPPSTGGHATAAPSSQPTPGFPPTSTPSAHATDAPAPSQDASASDGPPGDRPLAQRLHRLAPGDHRITEQQLRDFAWTYRLNPTEKSVDAWVAEASIEVTCMAAEGFYWDPRESTFVMTDPSQPVAPADPAARLALDGNAGYPYHWQDAGCRGRAIHELEGN